MTLQVENNALAAARQARLSFRPELRVYDSRPGEADRRYTVYDPVTDLSYFLGPRELMIARLFDGRRSVADVAACAAGELHSEVPLQKVEALQNRLMQYGLLEEPGSARHRRVRDPAAGISYGPLKSLLMVPVLRIDPGVFLDRLYRRFAWLCTPAFVGVGLAVMLLAIAVLLPAGGDFLGDAGAIYGNGPHWLLWHYPVVVVSILLHEVGHALACRHYRVRITDFGVAVYLLLATGWARPLQRDWESIPRSQRLVAIAMGPYVSLLFAAAGVLLWRWGPEGVLHTAAVVAAVSSTLALIPTLLPMFNGDAYLALTEMAGVPRLRQRAFRYAKLLCTGGCQEEHLSRGRKWLYAFVIFAAVAGWLAVWALLVYMVLLVLPVIEYLFLGSWNR